jgi:hypothetical protein
MFAGLDECGHAQWVSITQGEESKTLQDVVIDEELQGYRFILICMDDEPAQPEIIFKVLGKAIGDFIEDVGLEIATSVRQMKRLGIKWEKSPLELDFCVFKNREGSKRKGKYSFWVEDKKDIWSTLVDIDGFNNLNDVFSFIRKFLLFLELTAEIPVLIKDLKITDDLKKHVKKGDLGMFSSVLKERDYSIDNDKEEN